MILKNNQEIKSFKSLKSKIILTGFLVILFVFLIEFISYQKISGINSNVSAVTDSMKVSAIQEGTQSLQNLGADQIKNTARYVAKEIEIFLKNHPQTMRQLQADSYFHDIAVQAVGQTGYTAVHDSRGINYFHSNPKIVNTDLALLKDKLPQFWHIIEQSLVGDAEGFYDWAEADGTIKQKYMYIATVPTPTADGHFLRVAATTYIDEFSQPALLLEEELTIDFNESRAYLKSQINLILELFIILFVANIIFLVVFWIIFKRFVIKPLETLIGRVKNVKFGQGDFKTDDFQNDEIGQLAREFFSLHSELLNSRGEIEKKVDSKTAELVAKDEELKVQQSAILNVLEDVNAEKEQVIRERDKTSAILFSIGDGVFVLDKNYKIVLFNHSAEKISGFSARQALGKRYDKILNFVFETDGSKNDLFIREAMEKGKMSKMAQHTELVRRDGSKVAVADSCAPLADDAGNPLGCVVVFRDVTKEREIDRSKSEFVSVASHQLRTPLSAIKWYLEALMSGDFGKLKGEQIGLMDQLYESNNRMINLVNDLLDVSRIERGKVELVPEEIDLVELINSILTEIIPLAEANNITFEKKIEKNLPKIFIDQKRTRQAFSNLISNAVKYGKAKTSVVIKIEKKKNDIIISVVDHGVGIPKKDQARVFQKFFRAENAVSKQTEGTGLGLYIARNIFESSGGKIGFKSIENKGTTFWVSLPIKKKKTK